MSDDGFMSGRRGLPGLSRGSTAEMEKELASPEGSLRSGSPPSIESVRGGTSNERNSSQASPSTDISAEGKTILPTTLLQKSGYSQRDGDELGQGGNSDSRSTMIMSPTQGRIAADRPASPTKGMGGFVQSAMMKRSDSVNKRWSAQPGGGGLSRQNSTASSRSGYGGGTLTGATSLPTIEARPSSLSRGNSTEPTSRPTSSHSNISDLTLRGDNSTLHNDGFVKPSLPVHSRGKSISETGATDPITSPPLSPSKRYSPTKSSWLESALKKPESPKPKTTASQQPSWMTELSKAKQQRASANLDEKRAAEKDIASFDVLINSRPGSPTKRQQASSEPVSFTKPNVRTSSEPLIPEKPDASQQRTSHPSLESRNESLQEEATTSELKLVTNDEKPSPPPTKPKPVDSIGFPNSELNSLSSQTTPTPKPKPDTPPKKDFRSNLKPRQSSTGSAKNNEPEFKNVFGKLRKAETKNYVAPDELKNNILRGKAGLSVTGGPQRREKRDELKEDLLKQKEAMKQKATEEATIGRNHSVSTKPAPEIPEALQRRKKLSRSGSSVGTLPGSPATPSPSKAKSPPTEARSDSAMEAESVDKTASPPPAAEATSRLAGGTSKLATRFNPGLANVLARGPSPISNSAGPAGASSSDSSSRVKESVSSEPPEPGPSAPLTHMTKGRARGPKRRTPKPAADESKHHASISTPIRQLVRDKDVQPSSPPKSPPETKVSSVVPSAQLVKPKDVLPSSPTSPGFKSSKMVPIDDANSMVKSLQAAASGKPATPQKSPLAELVAAKARGEKPEDGNSPTKSFEANRNAKISKNDGSSPTKAEPLRPRSPAKPLESSKSEEQPPLEAEKPNAPSSVKKFASKWNQQDTAVSPTATRARSPVKLPTKNDEHNAMRDAGLIRASSPTKQPVGLGLGGMPKSPSASIIRSSEDFEPVARTKYPMSPPASTDLSKPVGPTHSAVSKPSTSDSVAVTPSPSRQSSANIPPQSPIPNTTASTETFKSFFGSCPSRSEPLDIDTSSILSSRPTNPQLRSTRMLIYALDPSTGKLAPLPQQEQHILYTGELYLCTHAYTDEKGTKATETYFWVGDDVSEAASNDSVAFARKKAREDSAKLVQVRQNKEPAALLQALGGILITRLGTRSDPLCSRGAAPGSYMLCTRRHLSHIVFDEVPLSRGSFCSGFTFLVLSPGKTFLWKGAGSGVEEYSTAKLTAMELAGARGADMLDVDEGKEPREFHHVFFTAADATKNVARSAEHWKQKRRCEDRYNVRLFRVEHDPARPTSGGGGGSGGSSSSSSATTGSKMGGWMGSLSNSFARRPSQQDDEDGESMPPGPGSPVRQRPATPRTGGAGEATPKITEVVPFSQKDLVDSKEAIWVLDAFFEVYV